MEKGTNAGERFPSMDGASASAKGGASGDVGKGAHKPMMAKGPSCAKVPRLRDFIKVPKGLAYVLCGVLLLFSLGGILAAVTMEFGGLKLLSPILLGPGLTILGLGALYDFTIRPLASFHEELHGMIARTYIAIGGLFSLLGIVFWYAG